MAADPIDHLLERYLGLLDEYTRLRASLADQHAAVRAGLARANFAAERGTRYGRDAYHGRMRAGRLLRVAPADPGEGAGHPRFDVIVVAAVAANDDDGAVPAAEGRPPPPPPPPPPGEVGGQAAAADEAPPGGQPVRDQARGPDDGGDAAAADVDDGEHAEKEERMRTLQPAVADPLRWFGVLTPMALRQAQADAVRVVEGIVPRLASVMAEMAAVEIEVRRARKRRAKAEAAAARNRDGAGGIVEAGAHVAV